MILYFYDYSTHVFKEADFAPEGELPEDYPATEIPPPEEKQFYDRVFDKEKNEWTYVLQDLNVIKKLLTDAVQNHMDQVVQTKGYDNIFTCIGYVSSTVPQFREEAQAALKWRDAVWLKCHELLAKFESGEIEILTPGQLIEQLPILDW